MGEYRSHSALLEGVTDIVGPAVGPPAAETLRRRMTRGPLHLRQRLRYVADLAEALHRLHAAGVVYGKLSPDTVVIAADGRAAPASGEVSPAGMADTALAYRAPEQLAAGAVDDRADIYALAALVFEMVTGAAPYAGADEAALRQAILSGPVPSARARHRGVTHEFDAALARALAKEPAARPPGILQFLQAVRPGLLDPSLLTAREHAATGPGDGGNTIALTRGTRTLNTAGNQSSSDTVLPVAVAGGPGTPEAAGDGAGDGGRRPSRLSEAGLPRLSAGRHHSLDSHFANVVHVARDVAGEHWPAVAQRAGLLEYLQDDPPAGEARTARVEALSRLNSAFEAVFGAEAPEKLRQWGRQGTERAIRLRKSSGVEQSALRLILSRRRKLAIVLKSYTAMMDDVRGEPLHLWKQVARNEFWIVQYANLYALGRDRSENACHVWTASLEAMLRWAGLADDWQVEEVECGCVNGTYDCIFAIKAR